jgi:CPA2 family monovalent cation:H+ antiporter-2
VLWDSWPVVLLFTGLVLIVQPTLVSIGTFFAGNDIRTSVRAGMSLAQIGEFSFIIAGIGVTAGVIASFFYPVAVAVCVLTSFTTPLMVRGSTRMALAVERRLPRAVQTFATLYASWREQLRRRPAQATARARLRRLIGFLLLDGAILSATPIAASIVHQRYLESLADRLGLADWAVLGLLVAAATAVALPFTIGLIRCARGLGRTLAGMVLPRAEEGTLDLAQAPRRAFVVALQLAVALLVGLPFLALTQPFLPWFLGLPLLLVVLATLGVAFWRRAADLEQHVHAGAHLVLEALSRQSGAPVAASPLEAAEALLPGLGSMVAVTLPGSSPAIGRTLIDLNLRGLTGASVIAIMRREGSVAAPTGREVLERGDVLTLTGTSEAVEAARELLVASQG